MDFFPTEFTFWTVLYYIFIFYLICYIGFQIYIYVYNLEYEIDCDNHERCFIIRNKGEQEEFEADNIEPETE
jgi:hypothetical protein